MRLKADWDTYLHDLRRREYELVFARCPESPFDRGLELGAGDGFMSSLLARHVRNLTVTDYYDDILSLSHGPGIDLRVLDAEAVGEVFAPASFDLIFSSNLLEHLPDLPRALAGIHRTLADDGLAIQILPSAFWKFCQVTLFYPDILLSRLDRWSRGQWPRPVRRLLGRGGDTPARERHNNPKVDDGQQDWLHRYLLPPVHGASRGHWHEWRRFRRRYWRRVFRETGFDVVAEIRGPAASAYGFGLDGVRQFCEGRGWVAEYAYVLAKRGRTSPYAAFFKPPPVEERRR